MFGAPKSPASPAPTSPSTRRIRATCAYNVARTCAGGSSPHPVDQRLRLSTQRPASTSSAARTVRRLAGPSSTGRPATHNSTGPSSRNPVTQPPPSRPHALHGLSVAHPTTCPPAGQGLRKVLATSLRHLEGSNSPARVPVTSSPPATGACEQRPWRGGHGSRCCPRVSCSHGESSRPTGRRPRRTPTGRPTGRTDAAVDGVRPKDRGALCGRPEPDVGIRHGVNGRLPPQPVVHAPPRVSRSPRSGSVRSIS